MPPDPFGFVEQSEISERFQPLHPPLTAQAAITEAHRCLYCFDAPCMGACPTHIDVPGFIKRIADDNLRGSARRILDANVLAGSCSRVCPVEVLCEGACVMHRHGRAPIQIALLQRHAMDAFHASGEPLLISPPVERKLKVACIGGGPASLACAAELRRHGAQVIIIERRALAGGLNTYGVAEYKLPTVESLREVEMVREMGVEFRLSSSMENATELLALEAGFDYVFVGVGLGAMRKMSIPGEDLPAVLNALELIAAYKTGHITRMHGSIVVVGAGNTAIDAAVAVRRLGAEMVTILYRRGPEDVTAFDFEVERARKEGVQFLWRRIPVAIRASVVGRLELETQEVHSVDGRLQVKPDSLKAIICDHVIPAIGQSPLIEMLRELRCITTESSHIVVDPATGQTENPRYFAGGDCANGGRQVVDAVADGKRAALGILAAANQTDLTDLATKAKVQHG